MSERVSDADIIEQAYINWSEYGQKPDLQELFAAARNLATDLRLAGANPTPSQAIAAVEEKRSELERFGRFFAAGCCDEILKLRTLSRPEPDEVSEAEVEAALAGWRDATDALAGIDERKSMRAALEAARAAKRGARSSETSGKDVAPRGECP